MFSFFLTDESGLGDEVSDGHWDLFDDVLANHLNVVLQLCRDGNDGSALCDCACRRNMTHNIRSNIQRKTKAT